MRISERRFPCKPQYMLVAALPEPMYQLQIPAQCLCNETLGVAERILKVETKLEPGIQPLLAWAMSTITVTAAKLSPEKLLLTCPAGKLKLYTEALDSFLDSPLTSQDAQVSAFVKMERMELLKPGKYKEPRIIQARPVRFNVQLGMYTRAIETGLKSLVDPQWLAKGIRAPVIAKGHNLQQRYRTLQNLWNLYQHPVAISMDLSRWDMRVSEELLNLLGSYYQLNFPDPMLAYILTHLTKNRCRTRNGLKYRRSHGVTSGDMTTALGNCVAVIAIVYAYRATLETIVTRRDATPAVLKERVWTMLSAVDSSRRRPVKTSVMHLFKTKMLQFAGVVPQSQVPTLTLYDDGDDHVLLTSQDYSQVIAETLPLWWEMCGHKLTVEGVANQLSDIEFCQMRCSPPAETMIPDPRKVIAASCAVTGQYKANARQYLKTVWTARAVMHQGVPVLGPLFWRLSRVRGPLMNSKQVRQALVRQNYWLKLTEKDLDEPLEYVEPSLESRLWMAEHWRIPVDQQLEWETLHVPVPNRHNTVTELELGPPVIPKFQSDEPGLVDDPDRELGRPELLLGLGQGLLVEAE